MAALGMSGGAMVPWVPDEAVARQRLRTRCSRWTSPRRQAPSVIVPVLQEHCLNSKFRLPVGSENDRSAVTRNAECNPKPWSLLLGRWFALEQRVESIQSLLQPARKYKRINEKVENGKQVRLKDFKIQEYG